MLLQLGGPFIFIFARPQSAYSTVFSRVNLLWFDIIVVKAKFTFD